MKKKTKKNILNIVIIVLIFAMTFGGIGSVIFTLYYASVNQALQEEYTAGLEEEIRRQMAEAGLNASQSANASSSSTAAAATAAATAQSPENSEVWAVPAEAPVEITPENNPAPVSSEPVSLPTAPSLADFDTSVGN